MTNKILITGKSGFIGSKIEGGKAYTGDLLDYAVLWMETMAAEGIVHLAAKSNRTACEADPKRCIESNLIGLCNLLDVARKRNIWVIYISTFQVRDRNIYGLTKLAGEELCRLYQKMGLKVAIIRLPIVYGPGDRDYKVVTTIVNELKAGRDPAIATDDKFYFAYVDDVAKIIENEVTILQGGFGKPYTLRDLKEGIKALL